VDEITVGGHFGGLQECDIGVSAPKDAGDVHDSRVSAARQHRHGLAFLVCGIGIRTLESQKSAIGDQPYASPIGQFTRQAARHARTQSDDRSGKKFLGGTADN
jgi:hypothetical protein